VLGKKPNWEKKGQTKSESDDSSRRNPEHSSFGIGRGGEELSIASRELGEQGVQRVRGMAGWPNVKGEHVFRGQFPTSPERIQQKKANDPGEVSRDGGARSRRDLPRDQKLNQR